MYITLDSAGVIFNMVIYKTTNLINGKTYIGQTTKQGRTLDLYLGSGVYLIRSIKKYGRENFEKEIIFNCENKEQMDRMEHLFICLLKPDYNIAPGGRSNIGCRYKKKPFTEEHKRKLSEAKVGKKLGEKLSKEHCELISKGKKGKKFSEQHKINLSIAAKRRKK